MTMIADNHGSSSDGPEYRPPPTAPASDLFRALIDRLRRREGDKLLAVSECFGQFEIGPGLLTILGAPPGAGKSALASQCLFDALEADGNLTALVANAEMSWDVLARRELARKTGIFDKDLRFGTITDRQFEQIEAAAADLMPLMDRIRVLQPPFLIAAVEDAASGAKPGLLILDYLQKFAPPGDPREGVNNVMTRLRWLAMDGWAILALSSTTRTKVKGGSGHDSKGLSLASFKESGEVEFNADACYLLRDVGPHEGKTRQRQVVLDCVKNRNGQQAQRGLVFNMPRMEFTACVSTAPEEPGDAFEWNPADDPYTSTPF